MIDVSDFYLNAPDLYFGDIEIPHLLTDENGGFDSLLLGQVLLEVVD